MVSSSFLTFSYAILWCELYYLLKRNKIFPWKHKKKLPWKLAHLKEDLIFFSAALTAQNSPELKIHIVNVAQDTSVYYSVTTTM